MCQELVGGQMVATSTRSTHVSVNCHVGGQMVATSTRSTLVSLNYHVGGQMVIH